MKKESARSRRIGAQPVVIRLLEDICELIEGARERAALTVNFELSQLNWNIGRRVRQDILKEMRAEYGRQIVSTLSRQLEADYGSGFSEKNLWHMVRFAEVFPKHQIVSTLWRELTWSHLKVLIYIQDPIKREFYTELCRHERWSVRALQDKIQGMLYERTGISRKPAELARKELVALRKEDRMTPDLVFRDPYFLDFLGLQDTFSEKDLESAILRSLEQFIIEFGNDFAFIARQKRITIDSDDYYIDLLFYHRGMQRLVAIDLKLGKFQAADKGQMELYLRWLDKYERRKGERNPLGLILCAGKSNEHVELLQLEKTGIRVAEYLAELPPKRLLIKKLHEAIRTAREGLARRQLPEKTRRESSH
jgi:predicted nuclease of restriction endonuclease-like (RecB) superfamily